MLPLIQTSEDKRNLDNSKTIEYEKMYFQENLRGHLKIK